MTLFNLATTFQSHLYLVTIKIQLFTIGGVDVNLLYIYRFVRFLIVIGVIFLSGATLFYISTFTYPFIIAMILAFLMNPLVSFLEQKARLPRSLSVILSLLLIFSVLAGLIVLLITEIVSGTNYLASVIPTHIETFVTYIENFIANTIIPFYNETATLFNKLDITQQQTIIKNIQDIGHNFTTDASHFIQTSLKYIPTIIGLIPSTVTVLLFSLMATFFISKDWDRLKRGTGNILPQKFFSDGQRVMRDLKQALLGFITAQFTLLSLTTIIILIGLLILRVNYAITIALICGLIDFIPYLGTGSIFIPWIIFELITGDTGYAIGLTVLYIVVLVQRQLIEPKVLSSSIGLNPLATLIALFIGFKWIGFLGLILGPIILVIINTLYRANIFHEIWTFIVGKKTL